MRLAFLGTPSPAVPTLQALVAAGHDVRSVVTRPDRKRGRGSALIASPVKIAAEALGLSVQHRLKDLDLDEIDLVVVVAYGVIIPEAMLQRVPMLNVHFSLLPRWRGAAPVQRAVLAGDKETGVSIISLEATLDTGPVHAIAAIDVGEKTVEELFRELADLGAHLLVSVVDTPALLSASIPQTGDVTYADKVAKEELRLVPAHAAEFCLRTVRVGGAYCFVSEKRLGVVRASRTVESVEPGFMVSRDGVVLAGTNDGAIVLEQVRPEGSNTMDGRSWWRGRFGPDESVAWS